MFGLNFGVELELEGFQPEPLRTVLRAKGMRAGLREVSFRDTFFPFTVKRDGSIPLGSEVTTPIMNEEQLDHLKRMVSMLQSCGMKQGNGCGLHVHVGLPEGVCPLFRETKDRWTGVKEVLYHNWKVLLPNITRAYGPQKERQRFCRMDFDKNEFGRERYLAMNATLSRYETVEYRFFDCHLHFRAICRAIRLACGLTSLALKGIRVQPCNPGEAVETILQAHEIQIRRNK